MKFSEIVQKFKADQHSLIQFGDRNPEITGVAAIDKAVAGQISYIEGGKFARYLKTTQAAALILPLDSKLQAEADSRGIAWLSVAAPRLFSPAIALFYRPFAPAPGIHPSAVIDPSARLGAEVSVGANAVIHTDVKLGEGVCVHANVVIYPEAQIGDRSILYANCVIYERSQIGANCVIHSGTAIGSEGFGFVPTATGWEKMEQSGYTVIEDSVEIGSNSTVDRPAVGETRIGRNTKLDNMVHIGHGCQVGEAVVMAAQVALAGGVTIGDRVVLSGQVGIVNQVTIGDRAVVGAKSGVTGDVDPHTVVSGNPAIPHPIYLRAAAIYKRLPEMYKMFRQLKQSR
ncbi:MAG: UDP-3-O-(3-hydroxymyristoyl)glucosamine N-acyltransferase [Leptolyngbyaceae cyanobacterium SL_1_1]|nr:UDP-3-O-(3-hydroxymyristoyl)glucosamine N-acyltransferase [Leptolyngbyaceae cyanobacterium SL_1_1]